MVSFPGNSESPPKLLVEGHAEVRFLDLDLGSWWLQAAAGCIVWIAQLIASCSSTICCRDLFFIYRKQIGLGLEFGFRVRLWVWAQAGMLDLLNTHSLAGRLA